MTSSQKAHILAGTPAAIIKEKLWHKDYIIIMIAAFGVSFTTFFFLSTLPIYAKKFSGSDAYLGFITAAYTLSALAVRPVSGILSDRIGRVKMLIIGALICAAACISYQFSKSVFLLIVLRIFNGIGFGIHSTSAGAVAADIIPKSRLTEGMGYFGLYGTIASATAPAIALSAIGDGRTENFTPLFIIASLIAAFSMVMDSTIGYERRKKRILNYAGKAQTGQETDSTDQKIKSETGGLPKSILGFESAALIPALVLLLIFTGQSSIMSFIALYAHESKMGNIGIFFTLLSAGMFVSRIFLGKIGDKHGLNVTIIPAIAIVSLGFLAIPFIQEKIILMLLALPLGLSLGSISPGMNVLIFRRCSPSRRGAASAAYFSAIDIGLGIGSILFGFVISTFGFTYMYFASFLFSLSALVIYCVFLTRRD